MTRATRAVEHSEFAHHRANLMFAGHLYTHRRLDRPWSATVHEGAEPLAGEAMASLQQARTIDNLGGM